MSWQLDLVDEGTLLVPLHRPLRAEPAVDYCAGWRAVLDALSVDLGGGDPNAQPPDFEALYAMYAEDRPPTG